MFSSRTFHRPGSTAIVPPSCVGGWSPLLSLAMKGRGSSPSDSALLSLDVSVALINSMRSLNFSKRVSLTNVCLSGSSCCAAMSNATIFTFARLFEIRAFSKGFRLSHLIASLLPTGRPSSVGSPSVIAITVPGPFLRSITRASIIDWRSGVIPVCFFPPILSSSSRLMVSINS